MKKSETHTTTSQYFTYSRNVFTVHHSFGGGSVEKLPVDTYDMCTARIPLQSYHLCCFIGNLIMLLRVLGMTVVVTGLRFMSKELLLLLSS